MREDEEFKVDGYKWTSLDKAGKLAWVAGFTEANAIVRVESMTALLALKLTAREPLKKVDSTTREQMDEVTASFNKQIDLSGITLGQTVDGLDKFYKDSRNMTVEAQQAIWIVKLEVRGAPQEFIDEEARLLRMPIGERDYERSSLLEKNQAYKETWRKWRDQIPAIYHL